MTPRPSLGHQYPITLIAYNRIPFHGRVSTIIYYYKVTQVTTITRLPRLPISNLQLPSGYQSICSVISYKIKLLSYQLPLHTGISGVLCYSHSTLISSPTYIHYAVVGILLPPTAMQQVSITDSGTRLSPSATSKDIDLCIGAGLPPISPRLLTR